MEKPTPLDLVKTKKQQKHWHHVIYFIFETESETSPHYCLKANAELTLRLEFNCLDTICP